ncbi:MAG: hypothetical protein HQK81_06310 [Desulfovibrionaceae bacterium]|nr:hypothetical protein [Desulfovibrionaceae bacterium]MBF0513662.1 hypothetical protein [Desulfovibrionaceae bacterium]
MGWASGSGLFSEIIKVVKDAVPDKEVRKAAYRKLMRVFLDQDWDTENECLGEDEAYDEIYRELYPEEDD